ncbi:MULTISPECIES: class I SAM-dependent methyltransferase [unclassified Anabaena]|uniref:methyltransferase domain-containing protein n=1 Tax=unclassified Anabaena TaxID=2619674 RepID=UPI000835C45B|nr:MULTISPECIES: class I SAM-dependent methyltransferase [unclassified Anabaena]
MKNKSNWEKTKFSVINNRLGVNQQNPNFHPSGWIFAESTARIYGQYLPLYVKGDLLDLGCGMCPLYGLYKDLSNSHYCIDWDNSLYPNPYADLLCDINNSIPLENNSFDTVILSDVLEHIVEPKSLLQEIHRLLRKDGVVILNVPFFERIHESPYDYYRYTEFTLKEIISSVGLKLEVFEVVGGAIESWSYMTANLSRFLPLIEKILPIMLFYFVFLLKKSNYISKKMKTLDSLYPSGYFCVARKI